MKKPLIIIVFLLFTLSSCDRLRNVSVTDKFTVAEDTTITLQQGECYGSCPVYKLTVKADGSVLFDGGKNTSGKGTGKIDQNEVRRLVEQANAINFLGLSDNYDAKGCPSYATDHSTIVISISSGGRSKTINHYLGCSAQEDGMKPYPPGLSEFEQKVIETSGAKKWFNYK